MTIEAAVEIQKAYKKLTSGKVPFTKKNMCDILVPLRDKYGLTDREVLSVAREELSLEEIMKIKTKDNIVGHWICFYHREKNETKVICSHCKDTRIVKGCYLSYDGLPMYDEDICPNCGAQMQV